MAASDQAHPAAETVPDDANDLRGFHFKRLMRKPVSWILIGLFVIAAGVGGAALIGPAIGGAAAVLALLVGFLIVFAIADRRAADAFFETYARRRGLTLGGRAPLPPATPLLRKGDDRYAVRTLSGAIADGLDGILALYTYEEVTTDGKGGRQTTYYNYTLGLVEVPDCVSLVPELYCQHKFGLHSLERFEDVFRRSKERVKLESEALDEKYEIFSGKEQDAVWLRRLFSPTFIVWLNEAAPEKFAFELVDGTLCCYVSRHQEDAADLDAIASATGAVASRLRDEARE
ncbi:MAG TPA: hypothetical protein VNB59_01775 [Solirubrobacterales bacterium]|jgi:hypothetical protein|nr:hypothetical protein [Solirubrobacterales bacterium]